MQSPPTGTELTSLLVSLQLADSGRRMHAEQQIFHLFRQPWFCRPLLEFALSGSSSSSTSAAGQASSLLQDGPVVDPQATLASRQLAAILLKRLVADRWTSTSSSSCSLVPAAAGPLTEEEKSWIRQGIIRGIFVEDSDRISIAFCGCLQVVASFDYPEQWPTLMRDLLAVAAPSPACSAEIPFAHRNAALRCICTLSEDLAVSTVSEWEDIFHVLLPAMLSIAQGQQQQQHLPHLPMHNIQLILVYRALKVVSNVLDAAFQAAATGAGTCAGAGAGGWQRQRLKLKQFLQFSLLPAWKPIWETLLQLPVRDATSLQRPAEHSLVCARAIVMILHRIYEVPFFSQSLSSTMDPFLAAVLHLLSQVQSLLQTSRKGWDKSEWIDHVDMEGISVSLPSLVEDIFQLLALVTSRSHLHCKVTAPGCLSFLCQQSLFFLDMALALCDADDDGGEAAAASLSDLVDLLSFFSHSLRGTATHAVGAGTFSANGSSMECYLAVLDNIVREFGDAGAYALLSSMAGPGPAPAATANATGRSPLGLWAQSSLLALSVLAASARSSVAAAATATATATATEDRSSFLVLIYQKNVFPLESLLEQLKTELFSGHCVTLQCHAMLLVSLLSFPQIFTDPAREKQEQWRWLGLCLGQGSVDGPVRLRLAAAVALGHFCSQSDALPTDAVLRIISVLCSSCMFFLSSLGRPERLQPVAGGDAETAAQALLCVLDALQSALLSVAGFLSTSMSACTSTVTGADQAADSAAMRGCEMAVDCLLQILQRLQCQQPLPRLAEICRAVDECFSLLLPVAGASVDGAQGTITALIFAPSGQRMQFLLHCLRSYSTHGGMEVAWSSACILTRVFFGIGSRAAEWQSEATVLALLQELCGWIGAVFSACCAPATTTTTTTADPSFGGSAYSERDDWWVALFEASCLLFRSMLYFFPISPATGVPASRHWFQEHCVLPMARHCICSLSSVPGASAIGRWARRDHVLGRCLCMSVLFLFQTPTAADIVAALADRNLVLAGQILDFALACLKSAADASPAAGALAGGTGGCSQRGMLLGIVRLLYAFFPSWSVGEGRTPLDISSGSRCVPPASGAERVVSLILQPWVDCLPEMLDAYEVCVMCPLLMDILCLLLSQPQLGDGYWLDVSGDDVAWASDGSDRTAGGVRTRSMQARQGSEQKRVPAVQAIFLALVKVLVSLSEEELLQLSSEESDGDSSDGSVEDPQEQQQQQHHHHHHQQQQQQQQHDDDGDDCEGSDDGSELDVELDELDVRRDPLMAVSVKRYLLESMRPLLSLSPLVSTLSEYHREALLSLFRLQ